MPSSDWERIRYGVQYLPGEQRSASVVQLGHLFVLTKWPGGATEKHSQSKEARMAGDAWVRNETTSATTACR